MSQLETKSQDGPRPEQNKAQEHITKAESFCQAAEFDEALKEINKAREICPELENINQVEAEIKSTAEKYKAEISAVREALSKKEFSEASSACERASKLCPQAEVTKSLEHKIKLEQAVQSGSKKREQAERGRRRMLVAIKAIGIGALVVVIVAMLFVSVSYFKNISWESKKKHHVIVPKTFAKSNSKKQGLKLEEEKQEVKAKKQKKFRDFIAEGANYEAKKDWENAIRTYKEALGIKPDSKKAQDSFVNMCLAKAKTNNNKKSGKVALKALEELLRVNPNHTEAKQLCRKISSYYVSQDPLWWLKKAQDKLSLLDIDHPRTIAYTSIAHKQAKAGSVTAAIATLQQVMQVLANDSKGGRAKTSLYAPIVATMVLIEDRANIPKALQEMDRCFDETNVDFRNLSPSDMHHGGRSTWIYTCAKITALAATDNVHAAKELAVRLGNNRDSRFYSLDDIYFDTVRVIASINDRAALSIASNIGSKCRKAEAYHIIASAQANAGNIDASLKTVKQIEDENLVDPQNFTCPWDRAEIYCTIAEIQAAVGNKVAAFEAIKQAKINNAIRSIIYDCLSKIEVYKAIVRAQMAAGDMEGARETCDQAKNDVANIRNFKKKANKVKAYCAIAECQIIAGDIDNARDSLKNAAIAVVGVSNDKESTYYAITMVQIQLGNLTEAKANLTKTGRGNRGLYRRIAEAQVKNGNLVELLEWIESVVDDDNCIYAYLGAAEGLIGEKKDSIVNLRLAKANDNKKDGKVALKALEEVLKVQPDHKEAKLLYEKISAYYISKDPSWWLNKAKAIAIGYEKTSSIHSYIIAAQARAGDIVNANATITNIENSFSDSSSAQRAYTAIAVAQARMGDIESAENTAKKAGLGHNFSAVSNAYAAIAKFLVEAGNIKDAKAVVARASSNRRDTIHCAIVEAQIKTGDLIGANDTAAMIHSISFKIKAYCDITVAYAQTNNMAEAIKTLEQAKVVATGFGDGHRSEKYSKTFSYLEIARTQAKIGNIEEAKATLASATYCGNGLSNVVAKNLASQLRSDKKFTKVIIEIEAGNLSNAKSLIPRISSLYLEPEAYIALAIAYVKAGNINVAREILREAFAAGAATFHDIAATFTTTQLEIGDVPGAKKTASNAGYSACYAVAKYLSSIPYTDLDELLKWIESIENKYNRAHAYVGAAEGLIEKEKY